MKPIALLTLTLLVPAAMAAPKQYQVATQIYIDGKLVSAPRIAVTENIFAEVSQVAEDSPNHLTLKILASEMSTETVKDGIMLKMDLDYASDGRTVKSSPKLLAEAGKEATVQIAYGPGKHEVQLKVKAIRN
jgi:hypothetical protein